ncbi:type II secretion system F family protein [Sulfurimonas sp. SAG-AH-194-C20]|nr:type II secretion system F family protein [Sulfurimonas sp. SAG-AH-194-C20]MDF1878698.1 type II secretion system F family protein [Sulfurimonas sp. SAG-AH-194-C20]
MMYFTATVLTKGKKEKFGFYAESKKEANSIAKLKFNGIIIKVIEDKEPLEEQFKRFKNDLLKNIRKKKIKQDGLISAIRQLAVMTNAGISIHDSLTEIADATDDEALKIVFSKLADDINSGHSMSASMENFRYELGNLTIAMVQLGEKTGNLDESLYALADMLEEIRSNITKFKKAMAYPRNVMIAMAVAFSVLLTYVVPQFKDIFDQLGANLPVPTIILLTLSDLLVNYGLYVIASIILFLFIFKYMLNNSQNFKFGWHVLLLRLIIMKNIIKFSTLSRFTLVFSELIRAGIPIAEALDTSIEMIDSLPLKQKLQSVRMTVEKGGTLNKGLSETELFENMILQMVRAGEDSGTLDAMIQKVAEYYKMRFDAIIDGLSEAIEPIMLFFIACMVILLALGIFLPMWDMGSAVNGR